MLSIVFGARNRLIDALEPLFTPSFAETVVRKVMTRAIPAGHELDEARATLTPQLAAVRRELDNLVEALARTGMSSHVTTAIRERESRQSHLERELAALDGRERISQMELEKLERVARQKVDACRNVLRKRTPQTRQIMAKLLRDRLVFVPEERNGRVGYRFYGEGTILKLLSGTIDGFSPREVVTSPAGFEPAFWP